MKEAQKAYWNLVVLTAVLAILIVKGLVSVG